MRRVPGPRPAARAEPRLKPGRRRAAPEVEHPGSEAPRQQEELPPTRLGKRIMFARMDLDAFIQAHRKRAGRKPKALSPDPLVQARIAVAKTC